MYVECPQLYMDGIIWVMNELQTTCEEEPLNSSAEKQTGIPTVIPCGPSTLACADLILDLYSCMAIEWGFNLF